MYKEYLLRYPSYSIVLATQLIDSISCNDVKLHKKVYKQLLDLNLNNILKFCLINRL